MTNGRITRRERKVRMAKVRSNIDGVILGTLDVLVKRAHGRKISGKQIALSVDNSVKKLLATSTLVAPFMPYHQFRDLVYAKAGYVTEQFNQTFEKQLSEV